MIDLRAQHRAELVRTARKILAHLGNSYAPWLTVNQDAGTVSDRRDGTPYGYVALAWTAMSFEYLQGRVAWAVVASGPFGPNAGTT